MTGEGEHLDGRCVLTCYTLPVSHSHDNYNQSNSDQCCFLRTLPSTVPFSMQGRRTNMMSYLTPSSMTLLMSPFFFPFYFPMLEKCSEVILNTLGTGGRKNILHSYLCRTQHILLQLVFTSTRRWH